MTVLTSYLEPKSLTRCLMVSQQWYRLKHFRSEEVWKRLCCLRFTECQVEKFVGLAPVTDWINVYKDMDSMNIEPICNVAGNKLFGSINLAGCRVWVWIVQRSNGELSRSVILKDVNGCEKFTCLPVVELRIHIQNINELLVKVPQQRIYVDTSTRRRSYQMDEVASSLGDPRFVSTVINPRDSSISLPRRNLADPSKEKVRLHIFDSAVIVVFIHAKACSNSLKFESKAKFLNMKININGVTVPIVIPFNGDIESSSDAEFLNKL